MAETVFHLPDLGEGLIEAKVLEWHVAEGELVERNAPLVEVETSKSAVEIPSPQTGRVVRRHAAEDESLRVGDPLDKNTDVGDKGKLCRCYCGKPEKAWL